MSNLSKRSESLVKVAGIPAIVVGGVSDFFSAQGGWIVSSFFGLSIIVVAIILWKKRDAEDGFFGAINKIIKSDDDINWWIEEGSLYKSHAFHLVLILSIGLFFLSAKSYSAAQSGGFIAANIPAVSDAQKILGMNSKILEAQKETNVKLDEVSNKVSDLKKETSSDPRKELANLGVAWSSENYTKAVMENDSRVIALFLDGDISTPHDTRFYAALVRSSNNTKAIFIDKSDKINDFDCSLLFKPYFLSYGSSNDGFKPEMINQKDNNISTLISALCKGDEKAKYVANEYINTQKEFINKYKKQSLSNNDKKAENAQCIDENMARDKLIYFEMRALSYSGDDSALYNISQEIKKAGGSIKDNPSLAKKLIEDYCLKSIGTPDSNSNSLLKSANDEIRQWSKILDLI